MDSLPDASLHGILQARILEWVAMPSCSGSSQPRDQILVYHIACGFFTILSPFSPCESPICLLSIWIYLLCAFHINGIIQYMAFCAWLIFLSIKFSRWSTSVFDSFVLLNTIPLCGHDTFSFIHVSIDGNLDCLYFLVIMNNASLTFLGTFSCRRMFSSLLVIYLGVELLGQVVTLCTTFLKSFLTIFQSGCITLNFYQHPMKILIIPNPH